MRGDSCRARTTTQEPVPDGRRQLATMILFFFCPAPRLCYKVHKLKLVFLFVVCVWVSRGLLNGDAGGERGWIRSNVSLSPLLSGNVKMVMYWYSVLERSLHFCPNCPLAHGAVFWVLFRRQKSESAFFLANSMEIDEKSVKFVEQRENWTLCMRDTNDSNDSMNDSIDSKW